MADWEKAPLKSAAPAASGKGAPAWQSAPLADTYLHPDDMDPNHVHVPADDLGMQGLALPDHPDPAHTVQPGENNVGFLAPVSHNRRTGQWSPAMPGIVTGTAQAVGDAMSLPGDALGGKYDQALDPRNGPYALGSNPELIGRGLNFAATMSGGAPLPRSLGPEMAGRPVLGMADRLGIPLTKGQGTGDLAALTKEEAIRQGQGAGSNIMRNFDATQREAIGGVADTIGQGLGANPESMRDLVVQSIQDKVAFHKDQAASFYEIAKDGNAVVSADAVRSIPAVVDQSLKDAAVTVDPTVTPAANKAMQYISDVANLPTEPKSPNASFGSGYSPEGTTAGGSRGALRPTAGVGAGPVSGKVDGVSLQGLEQLRKQIIGLGDGTNDTDKRALRAIKKSLDAWTQHAIDNALISGDDAALEAYQKARAASHDYLSITSPHEGDTVGATVAKLQKGDATAEEVANWLYGADVANPTLGAPKVAERVKGLVGDGSPEWDAVRASAWERLVKDQKSATGEPLSNTMMAKRIETFLNAKGTSLSKVLYTDAERAKMQQFADVLKATVTPRDATNPSRSGWTVAGTMNSITRLLAGGSVASVAGPGAGAAAYFAIPVFKNIGARNAALEATGARAAKTQFPVALGMANAAAHAPNVLGGLTAPVISGAEKGLQFLGFGGNDNGLSPAIPPPGGGTVKGGTMTLGDWVKQQNASGNLAA